MKRIKFIIAAVVALCCNSVLNAQGVDKVTLVVYGDGVGKEEAVQVALRSAIEQSFGTFVSSDTRILNDELVKDEIATVSSGNVEKFTIISEYQKDGRYYVNLQATVSVSKLVTYTQNKGGSVELAGASFAANVKLQKLYAENERKAYEHMLEQFKDLIPYAYDYSIALIGEPHVYDSKYEIDGVVVVSPNDVSNTCADILYNFFAASSMDKETAEVFKQTVSRPASYPLNDRPTQGSFKSYYSGYGRSGGEYPNHIALFDGLAVRNKYAYTDITNLIYDSMLSFVVDDGIQQRYGNMEPFVKNRVSRAGLRYMLHLLKRKPIDRWTASMRSNIGDFHENKPTWDVYIPFTFYYTESELSNLSKITVKPVHIRENIVLPEIKRLASPKEIKQKEEKGKQEKAPWLKANALLKTAKELYDKKDYKGAAEAANQSLKLKESANAYYWLAKSLFHQEDIYYSYRGIITAWKNYLRLNPDGPNKYEAWYYIAFVSALDKDKATATEYFNMIINDPSAPKDWRNEAKKRLKNYQSKGSLY